MHTDRQRYGVSGVERHHSQRLGRQEHPDRRESRVQSGGLWLCQGRGSQSDLREKIRRQTSDQVDGTRESVRQYILCQIRHLELWRVDLGNRDFGIDPVSWTSCRRSKNIYKV